MTEAQNAQIHEQLGRKYDAGFITGSTLSINGGQHMY